MTRRVKEKGKANQTGGLPDKLGKMRGRGGLKDFSQFGDLYVRPGYGTFATKLYQRFDGPVIAGDIPDFYAGKKFPSYLPLGRKPFDNSDWIIGVWQDRQESGRDGSAAQNSINTLTSMDSTHTYIDMNRIEAMSEKICCMANRRSPNQSPYWARIQHWRPFVRCMSDGPLIPTVCLDATETENYQSPAIKFSPGIVYFHLWFNDGHPGMIYNIMKSASYQYAGGYTSGRGYHACGFKTRDADQGWWGTGVIAGGSANAAGTSIYAQGSSLNYLTASFAAIANMPNATADHKSSGGEGGFTWGGTESYPTTSNKVHDYFLSTDTWTLKETLSGGGRAKGAAYWNKQSNEIFAGLGTSNMADAPTATYKINMNTWTSAFGPNLQDCRNSYYGSNIATEDIGGVHMIVRISTGIITNYWQTHANVTSLLSVYDNPSPLQGGNTKWWAGMDIPSGVWNTMAYANLCSFS